MGDLKPIIKQSPPIDISKPYDPTTLNGKTILVTGGANGLGSHMVRRWASYGADVVIGDIADAAGEALVAELRSRHPTGRRFVYQHCDVTCWEDQVSLFETARAATGRVDIVVPNAGVLLPREAEAFQRPRPDPSSSGGRIPKPSTATLDVNVTGVLYTTHLALHHLPILSSSSSSSSSLGGGLDKCILLIGSVASIIPLAPQTYYTMSKHAVLGLFRSLRGLTFQHGIRVNMVMPYYVSETNMLTPLSEAVLLSGGAGAAKIDDVLDAATRLIADEGIVGRALVIGPRIGQSPKGGGGDAISDEEKAIGGRAVWESYAEDYDAVDTFVWRYIRLLNAIETARGWLAWVSDVWSIWSRSR